MLLSSRFLHICLDFIKWINFSPIIWDVKPWISTVLCQHWCWCNWERIPLHLILNCTTSLIVIWYPSNMMQAFIFYCDILIWADILSDSLCSVKQNTVWFGPMLHRNVVYKQYRKKCQFFILGSLVYISTSLREVFLQNICYCLSGPVFLYKLLNIISLGFVEMAIFTNPKPTIHRKLYENTFF